MRIMERKAKREGFGIGRDGGAQDCGGCVERMQHS